MAITTLRSLLYAPANRPDMTAKMPRFRPDGVILDLEDGTPGSEKVAARTTAVEAATALRPLFGGSVWLRVNSPRDPLIAGDLEAAASGPFDGVVVPKIEQVADVEWIERALVRGATGPLPVMWGFETVWGVAACHEILQESGRPAAAFFGAEDYIADLGGRRTPDSLETLYPRSRVAIACRLRGVPAIDQVVLAVDDSDGFRRDALAGLALGYRGKNCIHPAQVPLCAEVYSPTPQEIDRARRLLTAYAEAVAAGRGTANFEGQMIDTPLVTQARTILSLIGLIDPLAGRDHVQ
jgi:citrate lyase subunit beta/citryl-CoA lyase